MSWEAGSSARVVWVTSAAPLPLVHDPRWPKGDAPDCGCAECDCPDREGDPDSDGRIDSTDASVILAAYAKLSTGQTSGLTEPAKAAADANSDGAIDSNDASLILSYYALTSTGSSLSLADYIKTL